QTAAAADWWLLLPQHRRINLDRRRQTSRSGPRLRCAIRHQKLAKLLVKKHLPRKHTDICWIRIQPRLQPLDIRRLGGAIQVRINKLDNFFTAFHRYVMPTTLSSVECNLGVPIAPDATSPARRRMSDPFCRRSPAASGHRYTANEALRAIAVFVSP